MTGKRADSVQGATICRLLAQIEDFITQNDMENDGNAFGWLAIKDRTLVQRLRDGGDITTSKMDVVANFLKNPAKVCRVETSEGLVWKTLKPLTTKEQ